MAEYKNWMEIDTDRISLGVDNGTSQWFKSDMSVAGGRKE